MSLKLRLQNTLMKLGDWVVDNKFTSCMIAAIFLYTFSFSMTICVFIITMSIVYLVLSVKDYLQFKKTNIITNSIDLNLLGHTTSNDVLEKKSLLGILESYVEERMERDIIFQYNIQKGQLVSDALEKEMLDALLDSVSQTISPIVRSKLALYFGEEGVDKVIGRICFTHITLFVAECNKGIYSK